MAVRNVEVGKCYRIDCYVTSGLLQNMVVRNVETGKCYRIDFKVEVSM